MIINISRTQDITIPVPTKNYIWIHSILSKTTYHAVGVVVRCSNYNKVIRKFHSSVCVMWLISSLNIVYKKVSYPT